jgi:hypothetical protein
LEGMQSVLDDMYENINACKRQLKCGGSLLTSVCSILSCSKSTSTRKSL